MSWQFLASAEALGTPQSQQVADRFHLLVNLSATMERILEERSRQLILPAVARPLAEAPEANVAEVSTEPPLPVPPRVTQSQLRRQRRLERYQQVVAMFSSGPDTGGNQSRPRHGEEDHSALAAARRFSRAETAAPSSPESERIFRVSTTTLERGLPSCSSSIKKSARKAIRESTLW